MARLDRAIHEKANEFNVALDGRVKPGHDNRGAPAIFSHARKRESMPAKNAGSIYVYHGFPPARERRCGAVRERGARRSPLTDPSSAGPVPRNHSSGYGIITYCRGGQPKGSRSCRTIAGIFLAWGLVSAALPGGRCPLHFGSSFRVRTPPDRPRRLERRSHRHFVRRVRRFGCPGRGLNKALTGVGAVLWLIPAWLTRRRHAFHSRISTKFPRFWAVFYVSESSLNIPPTFTLTIRLRHLLRPRRYLL